MVGNTIDSNVISYVNQNDKQSKGASTADDLSSNFMTLFIAQLKNQDPLKPLENAELTSQLAQINMVNGIENLGTNLNSISSQIDAGKKLQATSLINRGVLVPGDKVLVGEGVATPFGVELAEPADSVKVSLRSSSGEIVRSFDLGAMDAGYETFSWDGLLEDGSTAADGSYSVVVEATSSGSLVQYTTLNYGLVTGVSSTDEGIMLDLGGTLGRVNIDDVRQVI